MLMIAVSDFCCHKCGGSIQAGERISRVVPGHQYHPRCSPRSEDVVSARLEVANENEAAMKVAAVAAKNKISSQFVALVTATFIAEVLLVGAIAFRNSPGYYILLRLIVCPLSVFFAFWLYRSNRVIFAVFVGFAAVVYNPTLPVRFPHETWQLVNGATVAMLATALYLSRPKILTDGFKKDSASST
jgi:hypothetical protein